MTKVYECKSDLSDKSDEELFLIYSGSPVHLHKSIRYNAGRILENRGFQFQNIGVYKKKWELEKWQQNTMGSKNNLVLFFHQHKLLSILFLSASSILIFLGLYQAYPISQWIINFDDILLFTLNILSFASLFFIFVFIGYFSRSISKLKRKRRIFELSNG